MIYEEPEWSRGDGLPNCPKCGGRGFYDSSNKENPVPQVVRCSCTLKKDILRNVERGWKGLTKADKIGESSLLDKVEDYCHITADDNTLKAHLRFVGLRQGPDWSFKVVSDADLIVAWLASATIKGGEIFDPDANKISTKFLTLVDLIEPPEFLVIKLGVKTANNSAMPRVLLEAIQHRSHLGKITWIVDQPTARLNESHLCYSIEVDHALRDWEKIDLMSNVVSAKKTSKSKAYRPGKSTSSVFARGQSSPQSHTKSVEIGDRETRKKSSSKSARGGWKR
jgi:hypothetical protein